MAELRAGSDCWRAIAGRLGEVRPTLLRLGPNALAAVSGVDRAIGDHRTLAPPTAEMPGTAVPLQPTVSRCCSDIFTDHQGSHLGRGGERPFRRWYLVAFDWPAARLHPELATGRLMGNQCSATLMTSGLGFGSRRRKCLGDKSPKSAARMRNTSPRIDFDDTLTVISETQFGDVDNQ